MYEGMYIYMRTHTYSYTQQQHIILPQNLKILTFFGFFGQMRTQQPTIEQYPPSSMYCYSRGVYERMIWNLEFI